MGKKKKKHKKRKELQKALISWILAISALITAIAKLIEALN